MPQVSRFAAVFVRLFTRSFAQEAGIGVIDTRHDHQGENHATADRPINDALAPAPPEEGARGGRLQKKRRSSSRENIDASDPRVQLIRSQCLKLSLSLFNRTQRSTRSLGFTSAIPGEGKTFLACVTASTLAERSHRSITLVDCNWDNPTLHAHFDIPNSPGLAEWLREECELEDIRHTISPYLRVIPSGDASEDALALAERFRAIGAQALLSAPDELLIADLPAVLTTDYGALLPQLLDAVLLVVRASATQEAHIAEASRELADSSVEGTVLNAARSSIPRWLLRLL